MSYMFRGVCMQFFASHLFLCSTVSRKICWQNLCYCVCCLRGTAWGSPLQVTMEVNELVIHCLWERGPTYVVLSDGQAWPLYTDRVPGFWEFFMGPEMYVEPYDKAILRFYDVHKKKPYCDTLFQKMRSEPGKLALQNSKKRLSTMTGWRRYEEQMLMLCCVRYKVSRFVKKTKWRLFRIPAGHVAWKLLVKLLVWKIKSCPTPHNRKQNDQALLLKNGMDEGE